MPCAAGELCPIPNQVRGVVEDVEVGYMACAANKRKKMGANSIVSAQRALPSDPLRLHQRLWRASVKRKRTQQANPNTQKVERESSCL